MNIQQVSEKCGLSKPNIRYYEKEGLIMPGRNPGNGYREYEEAHVQRLWQIKCLRALGVPLQERRKKLDLLEERAKLLLRCGIAGNCVWQATRVIPEFAGVRNNPFVEVPLVFLSVAGALMLGVVRNMRR